MNLRGYTTFGFDLDTREFSRAMREIIRAGKKDEAATVNKYTLQALIGSKGVKGAAQLTPKATEGRINRDMRKKVARRNGKGSAPRIVMLATKWLHKNGNVALREHVSYAAGVIMAARQRSRAYIVAGFIAAGHAFGGLGKSQSGRFEGGRNKTLETGASGSFGRKATPAKLQSYFHNKARGSGKIGLIPMQLALNNQAADMMNHLREKMQKIFDKHRGRK